jgi:hypothetical protein
MIEKTLLNILVKIWREYITMKMFFTANPEKVADDYSVSSVVVKGLQINGESKSLVNFTLHHTLW